MFVYKCHHLIAIYLPNGPSVFASCYFTQAEVSISLLTRGYPEPFVCLKIINIQSSSIASIYIAVLLMLLFLYPLLCIFSESDGNHSTEDESSKGQDDLSPHSLHNSDGVSNINLSAHADTVYMQHIGNKISLGSSGVLLNGSLVSSNNSPVFLNGGSFIQGPNGVLLNGLNVANSQTVTLNSPKVASTIVSNGAPNTDLLVSSSEEIKVLQAGLTDSSSTYTTNLQSSFPGLIPATEVKSETIHPAASQDGGTVVTFTTPIQINPYGIVQIPNSGTNAQLLNGSIGFSTLQLPSVAVSQGKCYF